MCGDGTISERHMGNPSFNANNGKLKRLYPFDGGVYFFLMGNTGMLEKPDDYYLLKKEHANYSSIYSLLLTAAEHDWTVLVACENELEGRHGIVNYVFVDLH